MSAVANRKPFDGGRAAYLTLNLLLIAFLLAPIAIVIVFALNPTPYISFPPVGVTLRWFGKFFAGSDFMNALFLSLWVAGCVLVLSITIGGACALALARDRHLLSLGRSSSCAMATCAIASTARGCDDTMT